MGEEQDIYDLPTGAGYDTVDSTAVDATISKDGWRVRTASGV